MNEIRFDPSLNPANKKKNVDFGNSDVSFEDILSELEVDGAASTSSISDTLDVRDINPLPKEFYTSINNDLSGILKEQNLGHLI